jgi:UPF0176 protein
MATTLVLALYRFHEIPEGELDAARNEIFAAGEALGIRGLLLLAKEGVNGTVCGEESSVRSFIEKVAQRLGHEPYEPKESWSERSPFKRLQVQVRPEIVTLDGSVFHPTPEDEKSRLSPSEWNEWLSPSSPEMKREYTLVDVRNWYETKVGKFKGAVDPHIKNFGEFPEFLSSAKIPQDKPLLMYCTGGIRCEKAAPLLRSIGYKEVYQLEGGILNYLSAHPHSQFEGECYVFDHRVAVDQHLAPSKRYSLCPHCGNPAEISLSCARCAEPCMICEDCEKTPSRQACSKDCAHHLSRGPSGRSSSGSLTRPRDGEPHA